MKPFLPLAMNVLAACLLAACTELMGAPVPADGPRSIDTSVGAIFIDDGGDGGVPVVFLHSFGGDSSHWSSQLDHLRHHRRAIAIDLRGHGKSARPLDLDYSIGAMARDVDEVAKALKLPRFVIVGHSLGAAVANAYAGAHPDRVAGVVLVGAAGRLPPEVGKKVVAALESSYAQTMKQHMEQELAGAQAHVRTEVLEQVGKLPREDAIAITRSMFADNPLPAYERYKGQRLLLYATSTDVEGGLQAAKPDARQKAFEGTSHWPHLDKPREFNLVLDEFLAEIR
jgi:pimeloyl-ACP methyl ester carboxylesterase